MNLLKIKIPLSKIPILPLITKTRLLTLFVTLPRFSKKVVSIPNV